MGYPSCSAGKESTAMQETWVWSPDWEEEKGYPVQYSGRENSMDYTVNGVAKSRTWLSDLHFLFFGTGMKTNLFQFCGHCRVFQICWYIGCSTLTASSFRISYSSAEIPSPPLTLFMVMLPKDHLTSQFRMPGSRWVITQLWLAEWLRSFLHSSCHLFLISSASVRSIPFLSFIVPVSA